MSVILNRHMASPATFQLVGGHLALDFINTVDWRTDAVHRRDLLDGFDDLLAWATAAGSLAPADRRTLVRAARRDRTRAQRTLTRARRLREVLARLLAPGAGAARTRARDLRTLNVFLGTALRHRRLDAHAASFAWGWSAAANDVFDAVWWPIALAGAELAASEDRHRIGVCSGEGCGWLFLDVSRNRRRRWCTMQGCGNRAKARRFYARARAGTR